MTLENLKARLLDKIAGELDKESFEGSAHYYATVYESLCRAETQTKMLAHAIAECENPFGGMDD